MLVSMAEIVVFGVVAADVVLRVPRIPASGDQVNAEALGWRIGGSSANVACGLSTAGHHVRLVGPVGTDAMGDHLLARTLRPFFKRVVAVDPEPDMVEYGRTRTEREDDGIEWRLARAEDVEFPSWSVDVVASGNAFHRFDRPVVAANATRWLQPMA
jgi:ubiquinone/menaquinone biosynthesis C-methylase UbiE